MSLDAQLHDIEALQAEGAVVLLKWDGVREAGPGTVVILRPPTDYLWRCDGDDVCAMLRKAIADYRSRFPPAG